MEVFFNIHLDLIKTTESVSVPPPFNIQQHEVETLLVCFTGTKMLITSHHMQYSHLFNAIVAIHVTFKLMNPGLHQLSLESSQLFKQMFGQYQKRDRAVSSYKLLVQYFKLLKLHCHQQQLTSLQYEPTIQHVKGVTFACKSNTN